MPDASVAADAAALVLSGPRLADGRAVDVRLSGGRIQAVGTAGSLTQPAPGYPAGLLPTFPPRPAPPRPAEERLDLSGYLLLPAPAEPHAHHDTALTADARPTGPPPATTPDGLRRRITEAALVQLGHGATAQRSHVRVGDALGLGALHAALDAAESLRGLAELRPVATPGPLTGRVGADNRQQLREAARLGVTLGGSPDLDPDPAGYADVVLDLAAEHGCAVDLHTDAADPARLARLAAAAGAHRLGVTLGPCAGLARLAPTAARRVADQLAAAGVTVACLPQGPCGPLAHDRPAAAAPPVRLLRVAGVRVVAGSGALRDAANPVGRGDPLEAAYLLASHGECAPDEAYRAVSSRVRAGLGLPAVRIEAGFPAELLAVRGESVADALSGGHSRLVIHRGRVVARTSTVREFAGPADAVPGVPRQGTR